MSRHKRILPTCSIHGGREYSEEYDAYYCPACDRWLESKCDGPCEFCPPRPEKPGTEGNVCENGDHPAVES